MAGDIVPLWTGGEIQRQGREFSSLGKSKFFNLSAGLNLSKSTVLQITSSYVAESLTPQGKQMPSFVLNTGFKQELLNRKLAFIVTVSDVFNSLRSNTLIDTPEIYEKIIRRRSARIIYAGLTFTFGNHKKKELEFDNRL
ncbi:MAG: outer membrane beta-barrel protein [Bacteroidia bacterium]|nr:outer membrane beta-barrel protein [Bacteroidia bacterium]